MSKKEKRVVKTKEELVKEMQTNAKFIAKMKFTKEKFYPVILKASKSIDDAKTFLASIGTVQMQKFLELMKEKKMSELNLVEALDPKDEKYEEYKEMLSLFDDMTVFDAKDIIEGMKTEIQIFIDDEMKERTLDTLKTRWLDEI